MVEFKCDRCGKQLNDDLLREDLVGILCMDCVNKINGQERYLENKIGAMQTVIERLEKTIDSKSQKITSLEETLKAIQSLTSIAILHFGEEV